MASDTIKYGKLYWCVKTRLSEDGEIYVMADETQTRNDGTLVFLRSRHDGPTTINLAISPGNWQAVFAANIQDGAPVAIEKWKGEVESR